MSGLQAACCCCVLWVKHHYCDNMDDSIMGGTYRTHGKSKKYRQQFSPGSVDEALSCQTLLRIEENIRAPLQSRCGLDSADSGQESAAVSCEFAGKA